MNKAKKQGTTHESWLVQQFRNLGYQSRRLAEGGKFDEGDVELITDVDRWVIEGKARQSLNIQETLGKTRAKANGHPVAVVWKRLVKKPGLQVRQPVAGERVVVILGWDDFCRLIETAYPVKEEQTDAQPE